MSKNPHDTEVKFLDDTPLTKDELKLHENIAKTIKEIINLTKDKNKKTIGLFGSWGSGKSTIIEILRNDIGEDRVFIFDSWSHKGDFLKRAFLLELARKLGIEKKEYKREDDNKDKYELLANNKRLLSLNDKQIEKFFIKLIDVRNNKYPFSLFSEILKESKHTIDKNLEKDFKEKLEEIKENVETDEIKKILLKIF